MSKPKCPYSSHLVGCWAAFGPRSESTVFLRIWTLSYGSRGYCLLGRIIMLSSCWSWHLFCWEVFAFITVVPYGFDSRTFFESGAERGLYIISKQLLIWLKYLKFSGIGSKWWNTEYKILRRRSRVKPVKKMAGIKNQKHASLVYEATFIS